MRSRISHFSWPDAPSSEVPSKPTLVKAKGVGQYGYMHVCGCSRESVCVRVARKTLMGCKFVLFNLCEEYLQIFLFLSMLSSWQSGEHRASVHQGEAGRGVSVYLTDAHPDPQRRGH